MLSRILPCVTYLAQNLSLAENHRVEPGRNAEEMICSLAIVPYIHISRDIFTESFAEHASDNCNRIAGGIDDVDFSTIARREHHCFRRSRTAPQNGQQVHPLRARKRELLANFDGSRPMVHADENQRHWTATSSNVPFSTCSQKSLPIRNPCIRLHSPAARLLLRSSVHVSIAAAYRSSKRDA